jgi:hypothetical protein
MLLETMLRISTDPNLLETCSFLKGGGPPRDQYVNPPCKPWRSLVRLVGQSSKIDMPNLVTYLYQTPTIKWYLVRSNFKNKFQKDKCLKKVGLRAQNMIVILGSIVNMIGLMSTRIFALIKIKMFV